MITSMTVLYQVARGYFEIVHRSHWCLAWRRLQARRRMWKQLLVHLLVRGGILNDNTNLSDHMLDCGISSTDGILVMLY